LYTNRTLVDKGYVDKNRMISYTVAMLPASPIQGDSYVVTDASLPTYLSPIMGGGSTVCPVFYNGTNWVAH
jgi:cystathionine beta-lyase family protein involved in aluminum resistance